MPELNTNIGPYYNLSEYEMNWNPYQNQYINIKVKNGRTYQRLYFIVHIAHISHRNSIYMVNYQKVQSFQDSLQYQIQLFIISLAYQQASEMDPKFLISPKQIVYFIKYKFIQMSFLQMDQNESLFKEPQSPLRATNATSGFKNTGRETVANWSNRINKDFNDLTYDINYSQFKSKEYYWTSPNQYRVKRKSRKPNKDDKQLDKHKFRLELMEMNKPSNPEKIGIVEKEVYSTLETQGLCKFQFEKTIAGRLKHRGHNHLDFRNQAQTNREAISADNSIQSEQKPRRPSFYSTISGFRINHKNYKFNKCHDFDSYSPRKVFEPREELDKIYDIDHYFRVTRPNRIKQTTKMSGITGRKQRKSKQSEVLAYEQQKSRRFIMTPAASHEIPRSPRKIQFGRQVILSTRGCYR